MTSPQVRPTKDFFIFRLALQTRKGIGGHGVVCGGKSDGVEEAASKVVGDTDIVANEATTSEGDANCAEAVDDSMRAIGPPQLLTIKLSSPVYLWFITTKGKPFAEPVIYTEKSRRNQTSSFRQRP